jgi:hypothetical protein
MFRIMKGRMWHSSCTRFIGVKALDEHDFIRSLLIFKVPPVSGVRLNSPSFPLVVGVDDFRCDQIRLRN